MAQKPLKKVKITKKSTKYRKSSKKFRDEESLIRKGINKRTIEMFEKGHKKG